NEPPVIHIKIVAKLLSFPLREMTATFTAEVYEEADSNNLPAIMAAFDHAFQGAQELLIEEAGDYFLSIQQFDKSRL
ncbi:MAG TPA: hypothetical protein VI522_02865, partial [Gammaproteobacteria bacterium]|nr:hypothetical protein [Gammaproteobacteria bacterium]